MPMIFYCTRLRLSKCNSSQVVSIKQDINFNIQPPHVCIFVHFPPKIALLKVVLPFETYQCTKFHCYALNYQSFASAIEVLTSAV
jgi:hypothetical protein